MEKIKTKSVLVIFGQDLPKKNVKWWQQFDQVIASNKLKEKIQGQGLFFVDIEALISPGSVQQAYELSNKVSGLTLPDGSRLSKLINYQGYELWWMHYDSVYYNFCLPYTKYCHLLLYLKDFDKIYLFQASNPELFQYFLRAHNCQCFLLNQFHPRNLLPVPSGVFIQILFSLGFLFWLKFTRPTVMIRTSDNLSSPYDFDFRQKFFYKELRKRKIPFVEFIRSPEPWPVVLQHAWQRRRPVIYSAAIIEVLHSFTHRFSRSPILFSEANPEQHFWFLVATHYLRNIKGTIWSIRAMKFILQWLGIKAAIIPAGINRTFHEILGCKLAGIKTVGIQYCAISRYFVTADFMPGFDGAQALSLDKYGLWSVWWKEYYLKYSRAFKPEQLYISGPMRPLEKKVDSWLPSSKNSPLKVLLIAEQLANPKEVMPYLSTLLAAEDFALSVKFRAQRDGFEGWLKKNRPDILEKVNSSKEGIHKAISEFDVVIGSHSTAVLEALAQLKPFVFFWTDKWGDYFDIREFDGRFFAENPQDLLDKIRKSVEVPKEKLKEIQEQLFGNPYQDGSKWVVKQAIKFSESYGK